jgi:hypothetical protein
VRCALLFRCVWSGGQDVQVAVTLQRIGIDDRAAVMLGQRQRKRRFAARGWSGNDDDGISVQLSASFETAASRLPQDEELSLCHQK